MLTTEGFIITALNLFQDRDITEVQVLGDGPYRFANPMTTHMNIELVFTDDQTIADLATIPAFSDMLHREMAKHNLCRYCGCRLPKNDKTNCTQCGGPRVDDL